MRSLIAALALVLSAHALAQGPQISEGVRAMMFTQEGVKFGEGNKRYMIVRQPPVYRYLAPGTTKYFDGESDLLSFFQGFPVEVQDRGLWITRTLTKIGATSMDRRITEALVAEAAKRKVVLFVCDPATAGGSEQIGWACRQRSPADSAKVIACAPRPKPQQGHPAWDCETAEN